MIHPTAPRLRRSYADGPRGQIHYYDAGGLGAPILLLHQSPASSSDWFSLIPFLNQAGFRVIAMDTPGMGLSDPLPYEPTLKDFADAVPVVLDHANVQKAHLLGHHTGVQIAIEAAVHYPGRVASASLYGVPIMTAVEQETFWKRIVPREQEGAVHKPAKAGANLIEHFVRIEGLFGTVAAQRMVLSALIAGPLWWHGHNAALRHDMVPAFMAAKQPLLLISHSGEMLHPNTVAAAKLRPDAEFVELQADGPIAMDVDPGALAKVITEFIHRVD